jgi:H2-forming N5,N10-methylenetetrahydromethanopterin dehydrogenase-like enzyme
VHIIFAILNSLAKLGDDSNESDTDPMDILETFGTRVPVYILTLGASVVSSLCDVYVIITLLMLKQVIHFCYQFQYGYDSGLPLTVVHGSVWEKIAKAGLVLEDDEQSKASRESMMGLLTDKYHFQRREAK